MSILSQNCRGLGNPQTIKALQKVIQKEAPDIVFLMETKTHVDGIKSVQNKINYKHGLVIPSEGQSGRTAMLWKIKSSVHIQSYSKWYIDTHVNVGRSGWWCITRFYGNPKASKREESWKLLKFLHQRSQFPWMVVGDLNEIIGMSKRRESNQTGKTNKKILERQLMYVA